MYKRQQHVHAQYYSVNYDARTVAAMAAAVGTEVVAESYYREQVDDILKHYTAAEVAAAGIFSVSYTHLDVYKRQSPGGQNPRQTVSPLCGGFCEQSPVY